VLTGDLVSAIAHRTMRRVKKSEGNASKNRFIKLGRRSHCTPNISGREIGGRG
jgi:hypothetical protein